jgi:DNA replication protein DnaC
MSAPPAPLAPDLVAGLRRLKLATIRRLAPEVLVVAKTQRWAPEELLRTLVEAEIAARDESNARNRLRAANFPVTKTLDEFDLTVSSVPQATFDYLASLEWIAAKENACLLGPAGTGKSHLLVALGHAAVSAGRRVRYFSAAELVENLYRGMADNSVGKLIDSTLRAELVIVDEVGFAPLDDNGAQLLFPFRGRRLRARRPRHRQPLALRPVGPLPARAHHGGQPARPAHPSQRRRRYRR